MGFKEDKKEEKEILCSYKNRELNEAYARKWLKENSDKLPPYVRANIPTHDEALSLSLQTLKLEIPTYGDVVSFYFPLVYFERRIEEILTHYANIVYPMLEKMPQVKRS